MSETSVSTTVREPRNKLGRFIAGNSGNGGRKPGSRNKLGEDFVRDLAQVWADHGIQALVSCAISEPSQFCRIVSHLLPKHVDISGVIDVDMSAFASKYQAARELLNPSNIKQIEHATKD